VFHVDHIAELVHVLLDVLILQAVLNAAYEDLDDSGRLFAGAHLVSGRGSLRLHLLTVERVRPLLLHGIYHRRVGKGDEAKAPGPLRVPELHDNGVRQFAVLLEVGLQALVCRLVV